MITLNQNNKIHNKTKQIIVCEKIIEMIGTGLLMDQDNLPSERELTKIFDVSRQTIRGALNILKQYNLVTISQGNNTKINVDETMINHFFNTNTYSDINQYDINDVLQTRLAIEIAIITEVVHRVTEDQLKELQRIVSSQRKMINNPVKFQLSDQFFHKNLATISQNKLLMKYSLELYNYGLSTRRKVMQVPKHIEQSIQDHQEIIDSLKEKESQLAISRIKKHITNVYQTSVYIGNKSQK